MPNRTRMIRKHRKANKQKEEPNILERLKKLSDNAPTAELRGGNCDFDTGHPKSRETFWCGDNDVIRSKEKLRY